VYLGSPGASDSNTNSASWGESRCEVDVIPIPPGVIPEGPRAAAVALAAVVLGGTAVFVMPSKKRRRSAT
jgi:hypothetical protein